MDCCLQGQGDMVNGKFAGADSVKDTQWGGGGLLPKLYQATCYQYSCILQLTLVSHLVYKSFLSS